MPFTKATKFLYSKTLFNMLFLNEVGPLGRWSQERCAIKLNKKIDLAKTKTNKNKSASPYLMTEHEEQEQSKH